MFGWIAPLILGAAMTGAPEPAGSVPEAEPELTEVATEGGSTGTSEPTPSNAVEAEPEVAAPPITEPEPLEAPMPEVAPPRVDDARPGDEYVRIHPPRYRGTGMFVGAGVAFGMVALYQVGDILFCGGCAVGVVERLGLLAAWGSAAGGGVMRALHDSWYDTALRRERRNAKGVVVAGSVLVGVGGALGLANEMLWWGCWFGGSGPYAYVVEDTEWGPWTDCHHGTAQGLLDGASLLVGTGAGLLAYGLTYRKREGVFRRARVIGLMPSLQRGRGMTTLGLGGRF